MSREQLEAIGLGQTRADPVPLPLVAEPAPRRADMNNVIFVQLEEITMAATMNDDSHSDSTSIFPGQHFAPYGGDMATRAALLEAVRNDWAPYNIIVVDQRPNGGNYTMNVTSPTNPVGGSVLGIAPLDCHDAMPNNVTFAFHGAGDGFGPSIQATTIGQEVAHSYGLEHVDEPGDIMNPYNSGGDPSFLDECLPVVPGGGIVCGMQHAEHCGSEDQQNSHQELLTLFGPSTPDHMAPVVTITDPLDGAQFDVGASFHISVDASDDIALGQVQLYNGNEALQVDVTEPFGWDVNDIPEGEYLFKAVAIDIAGNAAGSPIVHVYVGVDPPPEPMESSGGFDSEGDDADSDGTGGAGQNGDGGGCGCRSDAAPTSLALLGLVGVAFLPRRRRAARA